MNESNNIQREKAGKKMTLYLSKKHMEKVREIGEEMGISDTTVVRALVRIGLRARQETIIEEIRKYPAYPRWND